MDRNAIENLMNLVDEIDKLCETISADTKCMEKKLEEKREVAYFNMCTELAPYYEIYKELYNKYNGEFTIDNIELDMKIKRYGGNDYPCIAFHAGECYICFHNEFSPHQLEMYMITHNKDFMAMTSKMELTGIIEVAKQFPNISQNLEKDFIRSIQKTMTQKAKYTNEKYERMKQSLNNF